VAIDLRVNIIAVVLCGFTMIRHFFVAASLEVLVVE